MASPNPTSSPNQADRSGKAPYASPVKSNPSTDDHRDLQPAKERKTLEGKKIKQRKPKPL